MTDSGLTGEALELLQIGRIADRRVHGSCPMPDYITQTPTGANGPSATPPSAPCYITAGEAAQRLHMCVRTLDRLVAKGALVAYYVAGSGHRRFSSKDVDSLLTPDPHGGPPRPDLDSFIAKYIRNG